MTLSCLLITTRGQTVGYTVAYSKYTSINWRIKTEHQTSTTVLGKKVLTWACIHPLLWEADTPTVSVINFTLLTHSKQCVKYWRWDNPYFQGTSQYLTLVLTPQSQYLLPTLSWQHVMLPTWLWSTGRDCQRTPAGRAPGRRWSQTTKHRLSLSGICHLHRRWWSI